MRDAQKFEKQTLWYTKAEEANIKTHNLDGNCYKKYMILNQEGFIWAG